jgi:hypothetical protein
MRKGFWSNLGDMTLNVVSPASEALDALGTKARDLNASVKETSVEAFREKKANGELADLNEVNEYIDYQIGLKQAFQRLYNS